MVPDVLPGITSGQNYGYNNGYRYSGIPEPSDSCKESVPVNSNYGSVTKVDFATWRFCACGESEFNLAKIAQALISTYLGEKAALYRRRSPTQLPGARAAAAVWRYNWNTAELTTHWLMDNDSKHYYRVRLRHSMLEE